MQTDRSSLAGARPVYARHDLAGAVPPARFRADRRDPASRQALLGRVAREYNEMPALRLTMAQARRLFALPDDVCARVLDTLVGADLIEQDADGAFVRHHARL